MIDTHCHLEMKQFDFDREEVIARAKESGFEALITVGSDLEGTKQGVALAEKHEFIYSSVGIHPHDARDFTPGILKQLRDWAEGSKVVAIGETGLDYHYDLSPRETQREVFRTQLSLARETGLPVVVHSREAREDTLSILRESGIDRGVLHCFSGDRQMAEEAMAMGLFISFAGPVTFKKSHELREIARIVPDDYLLAETDAPYLAPEPFRGKRNEPSYLRYTLAQIAQVRGITPEDAARITTLNAKRLFGIGEIENARIAYRIRDSLYLNITNRCTNVCTFCVKFRSDFVKGHNLRLEREPSEEDIIRAIGEPTSYAEVVFCGYGEPLQRLETVKNVSRWIKSRGGRVRVNTNGHANMIHKRDVLPELTGLVDSISISLDAQDEETYNAVCKPLYKKAYPEVLAFISKAAQTIPDVQVTVVGVEGVDVEKCREIAEGLGAKFRLRSYDVVG